MHLIARHLLVLLAVFSLAALGCKETEEDDDTAADDDVADDDTADDDTGDDDTGDDDTEGPLGIPLIENGITYAGAAVVDITPQVVETYTDLDGDALFDGCFDDPDASEEGCDEPFDDVNLNGWFDAVFIAGYDWRRPAQGVHDPITARALVMAHDGEYVALVAVDLVGLFHNRIHAARDLLADDEFDPNRLIVSSTHNHQGPDTMGYWGDLDDLMNPMTGINEDYMVTVVAAIDQAVRDAAAAMQPVDMRVGAVNMRDIDPYFNGALFGGGNPTDKMHGMIRDIRDPVIVSDQLLVMQGLDADEDAVFTWTNWSGHAEVWGGENDQLSSDWVGVTRDVLEETYGGVAIHMPECVGGMQSAGGGNVPMVDDLGVHVYQLCDAVAVANPQDTGCYGKKVGDVRTDDDGNPVPEWPQDETWEFVNSHGWHIAEAAMSALAAGEDADASPIELDVQSMYLPMTNLGFSLLGGLGVFDLDLGEAVTDPQLCPEVSEVPFGCIEMRTFRLTIGPVGLITTPGELLPEVAWPLPTNNPQWVLEAADPTARGDDGVYFRQHDADCDALDWADCKGALEVGDCNCLKVHAWPYEISDDPQVPPLLDLLDTDYRAVIGLVDDAGGYIIPEPDFNTYCSIMTDDDDHYEDTMSLSSMFATKLQDAHLAIDDRW